MSRSKIFTQPLIGGNVFHVYNQTNNKELLFLTDDDRFRFLRNLKRFVCPFADVLAYNLLSNHFHILLESITKGELLSRMTPHYVNELPLVCKKLVDCEDDNMDLVLKNRFTAMLAGYATYFNMRYKRKGNFLHRPFCRKWIHSSSYLAKAAYYIHFNAVRHGLCEHLLDHQWTSFHSVLAEDRSIISIDKLFQYFGGKDHFLHYHQTNRFINQEEEKAFLIEEEVVFKHKQYESNE